MVEHPILFSGPMVRSLLNTRKNVWPPQPIDPSKPFKGMTRRIPDSRNAKWKVGDYLWVKETWIPVHWGSYEAVPREYNVRHLHSACIMYAADPENGYHQPWDCYQGKWRSSLFMFRWMSRILCQIMARREERLQAISEEDAILEGVTPHPDCITNRCARPHRDAFLDLWDELNLDRGYPWRENHTVSAFSLMPVEVS